MKQFDAFSKGLAPLLEKLNAEEKKGVNDALRRLQADVSRQEASYHLAIENRNAVHALLKKTSEDLIQRYQTIFEYSGTAMVIIENEGIISLANSLLEKIMGYSREEVENKLNFTDFIPADSREQMIAYHRRRRDGDTTIPHYYETRLLRKDGRIIDVIITAAMLPGGKQSVISIMDISERKRAEETLKQSEARFRTFMETSNVAIFVFRTRILYTNPAAEEITGYSRQELLTMEFWDLIHPEFKDLVRDRGLRRQNGEAVPSNYEFKILRKDGTHRWVNSSTAIIQVAGSPNTSISVHIDITERKMLEEENEFHTAELKRYAGIMSQTNDKLNLMNNITRHDILNQLSILYGCLEMMQDKFPNPSLQKYIHHEIQSAKTIQALIMFTKDYQDIGVQSPRWFDLKETIVSVAKTLSLSNVILDITFDNLEVYADPLIEKVIYTLFDNALNHGKSVSRIEFSASWDDRRFVLTCSDNGVGVPSEHKEAIFQRKYFKHTGFGLFLSREILSITGISIQETGEPGKGARFEITVPEGMWRAAGISSSE